MALVKREGSKGPAKNHGPEAGSWPAGFDGCQDLIDFLGLGVWPDGSSRDPGTILLFCGDGRLKACLSDKSQGLVAFITIDPGSDILTQLSDRVTSASTDWRPVRVLTPSKK
jgi:hypothetical protein